ncbi:hypothetical protein BUALT_Bualt10G0000700 [Buddleja alternifolia]|uniref:Uncharacterized protein n=1 Tax=Buddleja alternifolia TaxID=168488 RepID=A0AAV6X2W8_9LAMI|nr:hypothetical protein BUALT_Bualt10G0000700 [Buddleja alternifolia]
MAMNGLRIWYLCELFEIEHESDSDSRLMGNLKEMLHNSRDGAERCVAYRINAPIFKCRCSSSSSVEAPLQKPSSQQEGRRAFMGFLLAAAAGIFVCESASAASTSRRALKGAKIRESEYTTLPNGLKYYDLKVGDGAEAVKGSRVAVWLWHSRIFY